MSDEKKPEKPLKDPRVDVYVYPKDEKSSEHKEAADKVKKVLKEKVKEAIEKNKSGGKNKQFDAVDSETKKAGKDTDPKKIGGIEVIVKGIDGDANQVQRGLKVVPKEGK